MELSEILTYVDHTLLKPEATLGEIKAICDDAMRFNTASVCIPPAYVKACADYCNGKMKICTVIGFPNGYATPAVKAYEAQDAIRHGADELDMVVNLGMVRDGCWGDVLDDIRAVRGVAKDRVLKVIIETSLLTQEEKVQLCAIVTAAGADFIKTSTGFAGGGATAEDVALLRAHVGPRVRVKAAGGIASLADAEAMLAAGADRLGTSRLVRLAREALAAEAEAAEQQETQEEPED